jgi:hypothetical protein
MRRAEQDSCGKQANGGRKCGKNQSAAIGLPVINYPKIMDD